MCDKASVDSIWVGKGEPRPRSDETIKTGEKWLLGLSFL